jgi:hypothetical protein
MHPAAARLVPVVARASRIVAGHYTRRDRADVHGNTLGSIRLGNRRYEVKRPSGVFHT